MATKGTAAAQQAAEAKIRARLVGFNILRCLDDPRVFGPFFRSPTWRPWRVFLKALFALPMTSEEVEFYTKHTGRSLPPSEPAREAWLVIGRRGGKSFVLATVAVYLACFHDWQPYLGPGERGTIMIVAHDRRQGRVIKRFISGLLHEVPMLRSTIEDESAEIITLKNRISIEIHTASFKSTRSYTIVAALFDEIAYWPAEDSAEPDSEIVSAVRPGMATMIEHGALLLAASSPHAQKGVLWDKYRKHFGKDGDDVLVWQAATREMNASVPQSFIDQHIADDPARAAAEYGAQFRTDVEGYVERAVVEAAIVPGRIEQAPMPGQRYTGFTDLGGARKDSFVLGIFRTLGDGRVSVDALRENKPPFNPEDVIAGYAALLKRYGIILVNGDNFAQEWPKNAFARHGINYVQDAEPKSRLYAGLLPRLSSRLVELNDDAVAHRGVAQLCNLERKASAGGRDVINHPEREGEHDDIANVIAGGVVVALRFVEQIVPIVAPVVLDRHGTDITALTPDVGRALGGPRYSMRDSWSPRW